MGWQDYITLTYSSNVTEEEQQQTEALLAFIFENDPQLFEDIAAYHAGEFEGDSILPIHVYGADDEQGEENKYNEGLGIVDFNIFEINHVTFFDVESGELVQVSPLRVMYHEMLHASGIMDEREVTARTDSFLADSAQCEITTERVDYDNMIADGNGRDGQRTITFLESLLASQPELQEVINTAQQTILQYAPDDPDNLATQFSNITDILGGQQPEISTEEPSQAQAENVQLSDVVAPSPLYCEGLHNDPDNSRGGR